MKRFASKVSSVAESQAGDVAEDIAKARAQAHLIEAAKKAALSLTALRRAKAALEKPV